MPIIYSAAMSLDGYIAGPGGDMSWLSDFAGQPDPAADRLLARVGALLVGGRTHRGQDPNAGTDAEGAFGGRYDGPAVVLTSGPPPPKDDGAEYFTELVPAVSRSKELAGDGYVNVLGATVARSCLDAGLLDEVLLLVVPVLLGDGVRVLDRPGHPPVRLSRLPGETGHWYRIER